MLRTAIALLAFLAVGTVVAQDVGTTAAVNPSARGIPPGGAVRTLALGDNIIHNERVTTDAGGLVQILFVDGTTLMMGPNSDLVIDSFFYDPSANTAQVAVTMTKGVLRFIGGLTSKTPDGATIGTPVGTIGIRGGIVDVDLNPPAGTPQHIDMLFGAEVTLQQGLELIGRLFQAGYSLVLGGDGNITVQKTPPEWSSQIQQALAGRPGTSGGSSNPPTDEDVAESGVPGANSGATFGGLNPPPLTQEETAQLLAAVAAYDELREFVAMQDDTGDDDPPPPPPVVQPPVNQPPAGSTVFVGASGGIVHILNYDQAGNLVQERYGTAVTTGTTLSDGALTTIAYNNADQLVYGYFDVTTDAMCTDCRGRIRIEGGTAQGTVTDQLGHYDAFGQGQAIDHANYTGTLPPNLVSHECYCDFLKWGFWEASGTTHFPDGTTADASINGTWVAGDLTTVAQLQYLQDNPYTGDFHGHAIATVYTPTGGQYLAAGGVQLLWDFGARTGTMQISDFDTTQNVGYGFTIYGPMTADGSQFYSGTIADSANGISGMARGGFINDGSYHAAGTAGDFAIFGTDYQAAGIFVGEQYGP